MRGDNEILLEQENADLAEALMRNKQDKHRADLATARLAVQQLTVPEKESADLAEALMRRKQDQHATSNCSPGGQKKNSVRRHRRGSGSWKLN